LIRFADFEKYASALVRASVIDKLAQEANSETASPGVFGYNDVLQLPFLINSLRYDERQDWVLRTACSRRVLRFKSILGNERETLT
jgi:hypothetical protein